jgi:GAF domain-containing protein
MAASSEAMRLLELFEAQAREGPCLDCYTTGAPVRAADLTTSRDVWPNFTGRALEAGFRSATALPLRRRGTVIGALNLFKVDPGTMDEADLIAAQAFADVATIALMQHRISLDAQLLNEQLQAALNSRIVIEQAKGMVAERLHIDMEDAFARLRSHARGHRLGLTEVASSLTSGDLAIGDL